LCVEKDWIELARIIGGAVGSNEKSNLPLTKKRATRMAALFKKLVENH